MEKTLFIGMIFVMTSALCLVGYDLWIRIKKDRSGPLASNAVLKREIETEVDERNEPIISGQPLEELDDFEEVTPEINEPREQNKHVNRKYTEDLIKDLLVLSVMTKPGDNFASYDLLQAITSAGLQFGDMNLFHYYSYLDPKNLPLFSLASATEPGQFDMDKIGDFSCAGLTLFTNLNEQADPVFAFEVMLKTAEQLADDLQGNLFAGQKTPWSEELFNSYRNKALSYQTHKFA